MTVLEYTRILEYEFSVCILVVLLTTPIDVT